MSPDVRCIAVKIVRFVDGRFPGFVECEFLDAKGRKHQLIDKVPIFTTEDLDVNCAYPKDGILRCEVLEQSKDEAKRGLVRVTTARPDAVESTEGLSEFLMPAKDVRPNPWPSP